MRRINNYGAAAGRPIFLTTILAAALLAVAFSVVCGADNSKSIAQTQNALDGTRLFRIGTGGAQGTYFPIGTLIARAISESDASCVKAIGCGVPDLLAVAQQSNGSVSNVEAISAGVLEAGMVQADVAHWAYTGTESVHLVVRRHSGMQTMSDLAGRRISLDEPGSGTLVDARIVLDAHGLEEADLKPVYTKPQYAAEKLTEGTLDAFFIVAGFPTESVMALTSRNTATLLPIERDVAKRIQKRYPFLTPSVIPAETYPGVPATRTLSVHAQLLVRASLSDELAYAITRELWSERTRQLLEKGHPKGREIRVESALQGIPIPLHPGAEKFYRERGLLSSASRS
jgi:TRAP-type uncharacterized transport system substrate-binding protein